MESSGPSPITIPDRPTFAVVTDGPVVERWQAACLEALVAAGVPIALWLYPDADQSAPSARSEALDVARPEDMPPGLPRPTRLGPDDDAPLDVDVALDLTRTGMDARSRRRAPETWAFTYGRSSAADPVGAAMRAIVKGSGPIRVALVAWPGGRVLRAGAVRTTTGSLGAQLDRLLLEPAAWPAQAALEHDVTVAAGSRREGDDRPHQSRSRPDIPTALLRVGVAARRALTMVDAVLRHSEWTVGLARRQIGDWLDAEEAPEVSWLPRRAGRYAADPFGLERDGVIHVLFEDFDQRQGKGVISATSVQADGRWAEPEVVLDTGSHASYPYLFEADGETWMIPETSDLAELRLYRATHFPTTWTLEARLLVDAHVSDATVVRHGDRWWLFGTSRGRGVDEALRVWHAATLTGPWQLHALDPVKIDVSSARPGGTPFVRDRVLYRPAQDCSTRYGARLTINRVDVLDERRYVETPVRHVEPISAFPDGLHTLSSVGSNTLIDGNRVRFLPDVLRSQVAARLAR